MTKGRILLGRILFSLSKQLIALVASLVVGREAFASSPLSGRLALFGNSGPLPLPMCIPLLIASILRSARYNLARYLTSKCEVYLLLESVHARNANLEQVPEA